MTHALFSSRDFRNLFASVSTSQLGDQFALIATPWLVLSLSDDPLALGLALALKGGPSALFMALGGAVADRYSPRLVLIISDIIRTIVAALMSAVVLLGVVEMWMVYTFALVFGIIAGFAIPAGNAMVPLIVPKSHLEPGNATIMGATQIMGFAGPLAAGILLGLYAESLAGVGLAFGLDAATFFVSALLVLAITKSGRLAGLNQHANTGLWQSIAHGFRLVWQDRDMRLMFAIIAAVNFLFVGPIMIGVPVLAETRLPEGAFAFGLLMSGFAGGNLAGYLAAGMLPRPGARLMRFLLTMQLISFAFVLIALGIAASTWPDFAMLVGLGIGNGYVTIVLISSLQALAPETVLGRIMSLFLLAGYGLVPISEALSGFISRVDVTTLFLGAGGAMAIVALWASFQPGLASLAKHTTLSAPELPGERS